MSCQCGEPFVEIAGLPDVDLQSLVVVFAEQKVEGDLIAFQKFGKLRQQAANNTKEQFANSHDLNDALLDAIMAALDAHTTMSAQALESQNIRDGLKAILLGPAGLYEALRQPAA